MNRGHSILESKNTTNRNDLYAGVPSIEYDQDRDEKPWQRIPSPFIILVLGVYLLLAYLTQLNEHAMPRVVPESEVDNDNPVFSEEAAWRYLEQIIGDKPRVAGTAYHYQKTKELKELVDTVARQGRLPVRTDWQVVSGSFWLNSTAPYMSYYQDLSNIIAVLEGESGFHSNGTIGSSVLLNCHYDSVPFALGASDNAVFCAAMMETLSRLSKRRHKLKHNIIFLFNGAEESGLLASHGFLQHRWAAGAALVVNLDAAGINGNPTLFQVTDSRVLSAYKRSASRPSAQSFGEVLFSSGLVPSDTDFRIWRDFGHIYGVDIAFVKGGHVYHTRYDRPDFLRAGVLQGAGNMLLALAAELAALDRLDKEPAPQTAVYYDFLHLFTVSYSVSASHVIHAAVALFASLSILYYAWLVGFRLSTVYELLYAALGRILSGLAGALTAAVVTALRASASTSAQLRYLRRPWLVVPQCWLPFLIAAVATAHGYDAWRTKKTGLNRSIRAVQALAATRLLLVATLLALLAAPSTATFRYVLSVPLFLMSLSSLLSLTLIRYIRLQAWHHFLMEMVVSIPSVMFVLALALSLNSLMLPIMGRSPRDNPDYLVAIINVALVVLVTTVMSGTELLFSRRRLWLPLSAVGVACLVLMFIPFSPYSDHGPPVQRHYWFHSEIVSHAAGGNVSARTSGVLATKHDAHTPESVLGALHSAGLNYNIRTDFASDCDTHVYCNLPLFRTRFAQYLDRSLFIYTGAPAQFHPPAGLVARRTCSGNTCTLALQVTGGHHDTLTICPRHDVVPGASSVLRGRPVYSVVMVLDGEGPRRTNLEFTFTVPMSLQSRPIADVSLHAFKINHPEEFTPEYRRLLASVPDYFNVATFLSFRHNYVF